MTWNGHKEKGEPRIRTCITLAKNHDRTNSSVMDAYQYTE